MLSPYMGGCKNAVTIRGGFKEPFWCLARWRHSKQIRAIYLQEVQPSGLCSLSGSPGSLEASFPIKGRVVGKNVQERLMFNIKLPAELFFVNGL